MTREEMHDLILGAALVALVYAIYQHRKAATAQAIAAGDQAAISTAIGTAASDGPAINIPAPIPVSGNAASGYTASTGTSWLDNLMQGAL